MTEANRKTWNVWWLIFAKLNPGRSCLLCWALRLTDWTLFFLLFVHNEALNGAKFLTETCVKRVVVFGENKWIIKVCPLGCCRVCLTKSIFDCFCCISQTVFAFKTVDFTQSLDVRKGFCKFWPCLASYRENTEKGLLFLLLSHRKHKWKQAAIKRENMLWRNKSGVMWRGYEQWISYLLEIILWMTSVWRNGVWEIQTK